MRGGTSKGVFFLETDLPAARDVRDRALLRMIGSPDRYGKQIDGMGGGTSSTSKVVIVSRSRRADADVDFLFGAVSIDQPVIDWSGNCGNLSAAVGPFAIHRGLVRVPESGPAVVRIWQANIGKHIIATVPIEAGVVREEGEFVLDGVAFPAAEVQLEFLDPGAEDGPGGRGGLFPTGRVLDRLDVPGSAPIEATLIDSGIPMIVVEASAFGLTGTELQAEVNANRDLLARVESLRAHGALAMGLVERAEDATSRRPHSPKIAFVAPPAAYVAADGRRIDREQIDLLARAFSMGPLHHAMPGTAAVALATAAGIPGTLVQRVSRPGVDGKIRLGHPSGTLAIGAQVHREDERWVVRRVIVSRSARRLMEGWVFLPG